MYMICRYLCMTETCVVFVGGQERLSPWGSGKGLLRRGLNLVSSVWGSRLTSLGLGFPSCCVGETKTAFMEVRVK